MSEAGQGWGKMRTTVYLNKKKKEEEQEAEGEGRGGGEERALFKTISSVVRARIGKCNDSKEEVTTSFLLNRFNHLLLIKYVLVCTHLMKLGELHYFYLHTVFLSISSIHQYHPQSKELFFQVMEQQKGI